MHRRRAASALTAAVLSLTVLAGAAGGRSSIQANDLQRWLTYIASDELGGRATFSAGLGLAAAYIQEHLREWGVTPAGDPNSYLQTVRVLGIRSTNRSSVTVQVGSERRTFSAGAGVTFPGNVGSKQTLTLDRVEFAGYGLDIPAHNQVDFRGRDVKGAAVVWLGAQGPEAIDAQAFQHVLAGRRRYVIEQLHGAASIGPQPANSGRSTRNAEGNGSDARPAVDFTTTQRLDAPLPPTVTGDDDFFSFLFSRAPTGYDELKRRAAAREPLPLFRLDGVTITFDIDATYEVVRTQLTHNVVAVIEGSDPRLKDTYVAFGAHYDHVGYAETEPSGGDGTRRAGVPGRVNDATDRIWNGADDDGSGTVALMALAKAFAEGPRPKRSLLFVWHSGEERGLLGSRYYADYPTVPIEKVVAHLNIDMIGRSRDDKPSEADTVYLVGSDRISSELHDLNQAANQALEAPLTLNYEMNDPSDLEQVYFRSDHYSYAAKGIPVIFFTTGMHADYHANTDEVSKIDFAKLTRVAQLVYETGVRVANLDHVLARDNKGPRAGKGTR
jgi:hypothetical protein